MRHKCCDRITVGHNRINGFIKDIVAKIIINYFIRSVWVIKEF